MSNQAEIFWNFSVEVYSHQAVAEACLFLQDNYRLDVNMILYACWYGLVYGVMPAPLLERAMDFSRSWQTGVVQPLRNVRQWMKTADAPVPIQPEDYTALRENIKRDELAAEHYQQSILQALADSQAGNAQETGRSAVHQNLDLLLQRCGTNADQPLRSALATISRALPPG